MKVLFVGLLLIAAGKALEFKLHSEDDVCGLFANDVVLRKPGSCSQTIKCHEGKSSPHTVKCSGTKIVKLNKMTCGTDSTDKYCAVKCATTSPRFIQDTKNCQDWGECEKKKVIQRGSCPDGQNFDEGQQRCIYDDGECHKTFNICDVTKPFQLFANKRHCQKYFYCNDKRVLLSGKCPVGTSYDIRSGKCVPKSEVDCSLISVPDQGCGTKKLAILNRFISDQTTCRGYFYCKDLGRTADGNYIPDTSPGWGQCNLNEFFDEKLQYCRDMHDIKCDEDRCDGRTSGLILSQTPGCQHYLSCQDGHTQGESKCPDNKYFDPVQGYCVDEPVWYPICS